VETNGRPIPFSFLDQFDMVQALVYCEVVKYGGDPDVPLHWERWARLPQQFLNACFAHGVTYEDLRDQFGLPR
jgi:hypothetical protein